MEYAEDGTLKNSYTYGNERISINSADETNYYLYDGRGSVSQLVNADEIVEAYTYDPFGNVTDGAPEFESFYGYNAEETNPVTGLQYLRARYYDSKTGRFCTADSYLGDITQQLTLNRYIYTVNNPVMYNDPSGYWFHIVGGIIAGAVIGAVTGVVSEAISAKVEGRKFNGKNAVKSAVIGTVSGAASGAIIATTGNIALASAAAGGISGAGNALVSAIEQKKNVKETVRDTAVGGAIGTASGIIGGMVSFGVAGNPVAKIISKKVVGRVLTEAASVVAGSIAGGFVSETSTRVYNGESIKTAAKNAANPKTILTNALTGLAGYGISKAVIAVQNQIYTKQAQAENNTTNKTDTKESYDGADSYQKQPEVEEATPKIECDAADTINGESGTDSHTQNLDGLNEVRNHLTNDVDGLDFEPNKAMMDKIEERLSNNQELTGAYKDFYEHELTESMLMKQGYDYNTAHNMALEIHNVQPQALYSSEIVQEYSKWFNKSDFEYWGISK